MTQKIILDTDPGIDDAMAIFMALAHPDIELLGLTTVFGNASIEQTTSNAIRLLDIADSKIPVARGAGRPSGRKPLPYPDFVHGVNGLGDIRLNEPSRSETALTAAQFIIEQVRQYPGDITLIAIGPLTNLAIALDNAPEIVNAVKQVIIMGGTLHETGNVSPAAEANIFCDPHAADKVMAASWPVTIIGLDVTHQTLLSRQIFDDIASKNPVAGPFLKEAARYYIDFYEQERGATNGCYGHDISAIAYAIQPDLFSLQQGSICVVTEGVAIGQIIQDDKPERSYAMDNWQHRPPQQVAIDVDSTAVSRLFAATLGRKGAFE